MNKLHVSLLAVLCAVFGVNAGDEGFSLHNKLQNVESAIKGNKKNSQIMLTLGKDGLVYNYAPDVVGKVTGVVNYITPDCIKNNISALPAVVTNNMPNAVNAENANRVLTEGLLKFLLNGYVSGNVVMVRQDGSLVSPFSVPLKLKDFKNSSKSAVNSMKDAAVAITAVEALAIPATAVVNTLAGEHAETIFGYASHARTVTYAICKQLSAMYSWNICN